jgi:hypothetical protein
MVSRLSWRQFPWALLAACGGLLAALWAAGTLPSGSAQGPERSGPAHPERSRDTHYVTPRQLADANARGDARIDLRASGWNEISGDRPVVLVFIKEGCPCNVELLPFFGRVEKLYRGAVQFAGVIDARAEVARRYRAEQRIGYPLLPDPQRRLIRRLRVEHGGYVALLTPAGEIAGFWPGCSADTMRDLGRRIARRLGVAERPLDVAGMPGSLTNGCPFE